ncbi:putative UDP-glucose 4-epimerase [Rhodospirillaceae bacterium LM-1]|nr:putative UDP-glucose 4-epimerase [Rhodospirillaceae bacterium LM-1]
MDSSSLGHCFITGGAGYIGSNLADRLLALGHRVTAYDNLSTGFMEFIAEAEKHQNFKLIRGDVLDLPALTHAMAGADTVFHLAANADVRFGTDHPRRDLEQNTIATFNVLEAMRANGVKRIGFSSTGSVYGEAAVIPTPEDAPFPIQTSLYGASKLAGEGLIAAYAEGFGLSGHIFRFVSVLGERYTHGHVFDFIKKLMADPTRLHILGDGRQRKSYMHVGDCIDAMLLAMTRAHEKVNVFNLGFDGYVEVIDSAKIICSELGVTPEFTFEGGERGWIGDNPFIWLSPKKIMALGWQPKCSIEEGVRRTVRWIKANPWVLERRS